MCVGQPVSLTFTCQSLLCTILREPCSFLLLTVLQRVVSGKLCRQNTLTKLGCSPRGIPTAEKSLRNLQVEKGRTREIIKQPVFFPSSPSHIAPEVSVTRFMYKRFTAFFLREKTCHGGMLRPFPHNHHHPPPPALRHGH